MSLPPDILIVAATVCLAFATASSVAAWADRRVPYLAGAFICAAIGGFVMAHITLAGGLTLTDVPNAFILVAARIFN